MNHINISAGESRRRVQLAPLSIREIKQHLNHFHYYVNHRLKLGVSQIIALAKHIRGFLNILITHNDCFPKCCEVVTSLREQLGQVKDLWFDTHIVMMTMFNQPQSKPCGLTPIS